MKKIMTKLNILLITCLAALGLTSCVQDLNTEPINPNVLQTFDQDRIYYKIYAGIGTSGQVGPDGNGDLDGNEGYSVFYRCIFVHNEFPTDCGWWIWRDAGVTDLNEMTWTSENEFTELLYNRMTFNVTTCNHFLDNTEGKTDAKTIRQRAEVRFMRCLNYYYLLDFFGNPPFVTPDNIGGDLPEQISRADLYKWIEEECLDLVSANSAMPNYGTVPYPRPTKGSVYAILARLYLNAQVYTGTPQWQKAKDACAEIIKMGYKLHANYGEMFMQDNTTNGSAEEFIFAIDYDKTHAQSWGGTTALICGGLSNTDSQAIGKYLGITQNSEGKATNNLNQAAWTGYHVSDEYVSKFNLVGVTWDTPTDGSSLGYDRDKSDKRAFFFNGGRTQKFVLTNHKTGWVCWKFSCLNSDGTTETGTTDATYSSADVPIFRLGEIYLTYAEADARLNGGVVTDATAKGYIKALRDRAGVSMPADNELTTDWLLEERARELMWEGCRRTDLIRYGYFTSMNYPWPYKGGVEDGNVALDEYRTIYPIIMDDLNANKNLTQNPGY